MVTPRKYPYVPVVQTAAIATVRLRLRPILGDLHLTCCDLYPNLSFC